MRILFVTPAAEMSISDVARGYRSALERQGHEIRDYNLRARYAYHTKAMPPEAAADPALLARMACENIVTEAMMHKSEYVIIVSGLNVHPIALWLLGKVNIPAAVVFTESPYDDESQAQWADLSHVDASVNITIFTNDQFSARAYSWRYLPPAYDPAVHRPVDPDPDEECDVLMIGTGWGERQAFLEAVDWTGIKLHIYGLWPEMGENKPPSPLDPFYTPLLIDNLNIAKFYASAKININFHRRHPKASTPGPRVYELAACGAFQLSDPRPGLNELLGDSVPTFDSPGRLGDLIRYYLQRPDERVRMAAESRKRVMDQTFDHRAADLMAAITSAELTGQGV